MRNNNLKHLNSIPSFEKWGHVHSNIIDKPKKAVLS